MRNLMRDNLALAVGRAGQVTGSDEWDVVFVTDRPADLNLFRRGGAKLFPRYVYRGEKRVSNMRIERRSGRAVHLHLRSAAQPRVSGALRRVSGHRLSEDSDAAGRGATSGTGAVGRAVHGCAFDAAGRGTPPQPSPQRGGSRALTPTLSPRRGSRAFTPTLSPRRGSRALTPTLSPRRGSRFDHHRRLSGTSQVPERPPARGRRGTERVGEGSDGADGGAERAHRSHYR